MSSVGVNKHTYKCIHIARQLICWTTKKKFHQMYNCPSERRHSRLCGVTSQQNIYKMITTDDGDNATSKYIFKLNCICSAPPATAAHSLWILNERNYQRPDFLTHIVGHQIDDKHVIHTYVYVYYIYDNEFVCVRVGERESSRKIIFGGSVYTQTLDYSYPFVIMLAFASFII